MTHPSSRSTSWACKPPLCCGPTFTTSIHASPPSLQPETRCGFPCRLEGEGSRAGGAEGLEDLTERLGSQPLSPAGQLVRPPLPHSLLSPHRSPHCQSCMLIRREHAGGGGQILYPKGAPVRVDPWKKEVIARIVGEATPPLHTYSVGGMRRGGRQRDAKGGENQNTFGTDI